MSCRNQCWQGWLYAALQSEQEACPALHGFVPKNHLDLAQAEHDDACSEPSRRKEGDGSEEGKRMEGDCPVVANDVAGQHGNTGVQYDVPEVPGGAAKRSSHEESSASQDHVLASSPRREDTVGGLSCMAASLLTLKDKTPADAVVENESEDGGHPRLAKSRQSQRRKDLVGEIIDLLAPVTATAMNDLSDKRDQDSEDGQGSDMDPDDDSVEDAYVGLLDDDGFLDEGELQRRDMSFGDLCEGLLSWQGLEPRSTKDAVAREYIRLRGALQEFERPDLNRVAQLLGVRAEMTHTELCAKTVNLLH